MRKVNIGLLAATVILAILNVVQFIVWRNISVNTAEAFASEISNLEATIAAYGPDVSVWTVTNSVKAGDEIEVDNLQQVTIPSSVDNDQYAHSTDELVGRYFKIAVNPGTPITTNMTMAEEVEDNMRDRDIVLDRITVGIEEGDYIDVRITMPYGDDYLVLSHKRVYGLGDNTVKLYLSEFEWLQYQGALIDYYLNSQYGCTLYADKYVEPGIQSDAIEYYTVPTNIAELMQKDPNIMDTDPAKATAKELEQWRSAIEEALVIFRDEEDTVDTDGSKFSEGRQAFNESVNSDRSTQAEEDAEAEANAEEEAEEEEFDFGEEDDWSEDVTTDDTTGEEGE